MKRTLLKYMLALPICINPGFSVESSIDDMQYEPFSKTKDHSSMYDQCKQSDVVDNATEDVTTQISSEVNNEIDPKNQIIINGEKQGVTAIPSTGSVSNQIENQTNVIQSYMIDLVSMDMTNSLKAISFELDEFNIDGKTLAILDIDRTILKSQEVILATQHKQRWARLEERFAKHCPQYAQKRGYYIDIFRKYRKEVLTEIIWKNFINYLKSRGAKVLVVTAVENGYLLDSDLNPTDEMWIKLRHKQLNDAIDRNEKTITNVFENERSGWLGEKFNSPYYYNGILASQPWSKDQAVLAQLKRWKWYPTKIIAIDDQDQNWLDFARLGLYLNVQLIGYKYTRADDIAYEFDFSEERALYRLKHLVDKNELLTDEAAEEMIHTPGGTIEPCLKKLIKLCIDDQKNQVKLTDKKQDTIEIQSKNSIHNKAKNDTNVVLSYIKKLVTIKETNVLKRVWQDLDNFGVDENTLAVLDIDLTILKSMEVSAATQYQKRWEELEEIFTTGYPQYAQKHDYYVDVFLKSQTEIPTEDIWPSFINYLKSRGAKVLVVTAIENGYLIGKDLQPTNEMLIELRHKQLNDAINPNEQTITNVFKNDIPDWLGEPFNSPYYYNGILASRPWNKDRAVWVQLQCWHWYPTKIIAIDDQDQNGLDFASLSLHLNAQLRGYKFTRANDIPYKCGFSMQRAFYQLKHLVEKDEWLTDEVAEAILQNDGETIKQWWINLKKLYNDRQKAQKKTTRSKTPNTASSKGD